MKYLLLLLTVLFSIQSYAADDGDWWLQRQIEIEQNQNAYAKKVYGKSARVVREEVAIPNSTRTEVRDLIKRSIAVDVPTAAKVGTPMFQRISAVAKAPGVQMVGAIAVMELIEAIGWVMDEGTYVKKVKNAPPNAQDLQYAWKATSGTTSSYHRTTSEACSARAAMQGYTLTSVGAPSGNWATCYMKNGTTNVTAQVNYTINPFYDPNYKPTERNVPLTAATVGAIMVGAGYSDPAGDTGAESVINDGDYTGVKEIYEHDSSGTGNEVAEDMDQKLRNASDTGGQPSYVGDPAYDSSPLDHDSDSADRSWNEDGDTATGDSKPETDAEGNPTGNTSISFQFPLFCSWASDMCKWYDDWKKSDKVYKDHMTKTEEHQTEEKTFWQDVKDWFDWTKQPVDEEPETEEEEPDTQGIFDRTFDTSFSLSKECPPDIPYNFETKYFSGSFNLDMGWLCIIFTVLGYPLVFFSHCVGLWILYEAVIQRQIKW